MSSPTVHILLATYNGENYLQQQLASIHNQTYSKWTLTVSDDGSTDKTLTIIENFREEVQQQVTILKGPNQGSSTINFFHLINHTLSNNSEDLYAFCDQDDVWFDYKLMRAVNFHKENCNNPMRLYCSRTKYVDKNLEYLGLSPDIHYSPCFNNAIIQNIASGNTMVLSRETLIALQNVKPKNSIWHDWTTYLVVTALGGQVFFDKQPSLLYRQHSNNVIGANTGLKSQIKRIKPLLEGRFSQWLDANMEAIIDLRKPPTQEALDTCLRFEQLRRADSSWQRLYQWLKCDIRRQTLTGNLSLAIAIFLNLC